MGSVSRRVESKIFFISFEVCVYLMISVAKIVNISRNAFLEVPFFETNP
jgi:hypothetical protein